VDVPTSGVAHGPSLGAGVDTPVWGFGYHSFEIFDTETCPMRILVDTNVEKLTSRKGNTRNNASRFQKQQKNKKLSLFCLVRNGVE